MKSVKNLVEGFRRFREQHFESHDNLYQQLVKQGQTPRMFTPYSMAAVVPW